MAWKFVIKSGFIYDPKGVKIWTGYAGGNEGKSPDAVNNPLMVSISKTGPLPPGLYTMEEVLAQSKLGPYAIRLVPDARNVMFGRSGFFVHGDKSDVKFSASEGCVIAARFVRGEMWTKLFDGKVDHQIQVVAEE